MTFFNNLPKFNTDYFSGINWNFMPSLPSFSIPTFFNFNSFIPPSFSFNSIWNFTPSWNFMPSLPSFSNFNTSFYNNTPSFNFKNTSFTNIWETPSYSKFQTNTGDSFTLTNKHKTDFSLVNYDAKAGEKLAKIALKNQVGFKNKCAAYVKNAIAEAGLGSYENGHGYQMSKILRKNSNFKEISPTSVKVEDLPSGCILVYARGAEGYSSQYGHTEITTGDGRAVSDGITKNLRKTPTAIFVPVKA